MEIDIVKTIGAVTRTIESREREGRPARALIASRTYDTSVDDLWDAITNPERIPRWLTPISGELRLGGQYQLHGNASGRILRCEPPTCPRGHVGIRWRCELGGRRHRTGSTRSTSRSHACRACDGRVVGPVRSGRRGSGLGSLVVGSRVTRRVTRSNEPGAERDLVGVGRGETFHAIEQRTVGRCVGGSGDESRKGGRSRGANHGVLHGRGRKSGLNARVRRSL